MMDKDLGRDPAGICETGAEEQVRQELSRAYGCELRIRPRDFLEKSMAGLFSRQPDMSGDQRKRLLPHELAAVGRETNNLMKALIGLAEKAASPKTPPETSHERY